MDQMILIQLSCIQHLHPDRGQWRDLQTKVLGEKEANQECDCDFISSGRSVVDSV